MRFPRIAGTIERRILLNFRIRPERVARLLPAPFEPAVVRDWAIGGICLIRLARIRPSLVPDFVGLRSENCAHRVAVQWRDGSTLRNGVYVLRRDTNQWLSALAGGRLFPGVHHHARFRVEETPSSWSIQVESSAVPMTVSVAVHLAPELPRGSIFSSLGEASDFFRAGSIGYSAKRSPRSFDGVRLICDEWNVEALHVERAESSFFADRNLFPPGTAKLDSALLMRDLRHEWHGIEDLCCDTEGLDSIVACPGNA